MENKENFKEKTQNARVKLLLIAGLSAVATTLIVAHTILTWQNKKNEKTIVGSSKKIESQKKNNLSDEESQKQFVKEEEHQEEEQEDADSLEYIELEEIKIDWLKKPAEVKAEECQGDQCFLVGKIDNNSQEERDSYYEDKNFYVELTATMGGSNIMHYIIDDSSGVPIKKYAKNYPEENKSKIFGINDIPSEITFPGTNYRLKKHYNPSYLFSEIETEKNLFKHDNLGDIWLTKGGCVVAKLPDGTAIAYDIIIPFMEEENRVLDLTFNNGKKNKDEYDYIEHSCGGMCTMLLDIDEKVLNPEARLEVIGKAINGENVYGIKDSEDQYLKNLYEDKGTAAYYGEDYSDSNDKSKYSYEEFLKLKPYIYWKDPLGRWIEFKNSKFSPLAEMCKPVVYLYPEKEINLNLSIDIKGWLTHTEPQYKNGWKISASPDGKIKNLEDGKMYDSLLWEGMGINYPQENTGWVVRREELDAFFGEKLKILGLQGREIEDFKVYWLDKLSEKPYYRISFLSERQFNALASIDFSPIGPDVFIRVMMTVKGLDKYEKISEQRLPSRAPERRSFTAVEWGGALLK